METNNAFTDTLRQMWTTRPPRIPEDQGGKAVIAGVCEGIGARYRIDPVLVRLVFVALSLVMGCGIFLYTLCWISMPRFGMTTTPWDSARKPKSELSEAALKEKSTGYVLAFIIGFALLNWFSNMVGDTPPGYQILGVAIGFGCWYGLHNRVPQPPAGLLPEPSLADAGDTPTAQHTVDTSHLTVPEGYPHPGVGTTTPPAWDPLGAAPELWHLPDPGQPVPEPEPVRSKNRPLWFWIPVALALSAATLTLLEVADQGARTFGAKEITSYNVDAINPLRTHGGAVTVDLRELEPLDEETTLEISNGFGRLDIKLPDNIPLEIHCTADLGGAVCPTGVQNPDGDGKMLTINARQQVGPLTAAY
ncbi:PspC domain-containing protein [Corynebacterium sp. TA-R-1]|uniref:PspC domain-containing protein n=1 Tax=Corynebacterium stercoris TaxID=2943490 RepID=A0ABT1G1C8_9CORY|nr:PspC domain-containing protein [Corynebacterium stercoris]MCP1387795.1 PspC domain-containing protein [Corynebacterium stercoris]